MNSCQTEAEKKAGQIFILSLGRPRPSVFMMCFSAAIVMYRGEVCVSVFVRYHNWTQASLRRFSGCSAGSLNVVGGVTVIGDIN